MRRSALFAPKTIALMLGLLAAGVSFQARADASCAPPEAGFHLQSFKAQAGQVTDCLYVRNTPSQPPAAAPQVSVTQSVTQQQGYGPPPGAYACGGDSRGSNCPQGSDNCCQPRTPAYNPPPAAPQSPCGYAYNYYGQQPCGVVFIPNPYQQLGGGWPYYRR